MSLDVSGLSVYTDENKMDLIKKSILEGRTMEYITIQPDIKSSATINILDSTLVGQAGACGFSPDGTTALTQRAIAVTPIKINESICLNTLESYYTQKMMNPGSYNEAIPFEQLYSEEKAGKINAMLEDIIWKGDTAGAGNIALADGLLKLIDSLGTVVDGNVGGETSITAANVVDIVDGMVGVVPTDIINKDDLVLFVGYDTYRTYAKALRDANLFHYTGAENSDFIQVVPGTNVKVVAVRGLNGTNRLVLSTSANIYAGTDLLSDAEDFKIFYSNDNDEVRFIAKFKIGVQVAFPEFVVEYTNV
ncbi:MAG: hypothetical protein Unbinned706contig1001_24 [Prokaryotic dsDNA virus sp.]|nr:MAG: hypothetical protein Unbinned706contig1001_24 [Prokaryotic dsDNA virus sp.]|tara:strand:- start:21086 stop:22003 length:918 start_codon:yes stop_codon:yes gene_type:complete